MRKYLVWIPILVFLLFSRFFLLSAVPATIPHDEMVYAIQAKSYVTQGTALDGIHRPWMISPFDPMYAELPATYMALGFLLSSDPLVATHLTSALIGFTLPFFLGWLFFSLWKNKTVAIGITIVAVFNPLLWQMSRLGYDTWYSLWLYIVGGSLLVQPKQRVRWLSLIFFFLGFFNYQGYKLLLLPWVLLVVFLQATANKSIPNWTTIKRTIANHTFKNSIVLQTAKRWLPQLVALLFALSITVYYGFVLLPKQVGVSERLNKTIFSDTEKIAQLVDLERRQAFVSPLLNLYTNKATVTINFMLDRLANAFDLNLLFLQVEPAVSGFSVWVHGIFYWIEGVFILIGFAWVFSQAKLRMNGVVLLLGILGLCLPTLINTGSEWHLLRTMFSYTLLVVFAGIGFAWIIKRPLALILTIPFYLLVIGNFTYVYFFRYPVISLDWGNYHERLVARYITLLSLEHPDTQVSVHVGQPNYYYWSYLLYSDRLTDENKELVAQNALLDTKAPVQTFKIDNVTFTSSCEVESNTGIMVAETSFQDCETEVANFDRAKIGQNQIATDSASIQKQRSFNSIVAILDSGEKLYILDDQLCSGKKLKSYVFPTSYKDIGVEKLNTDQFCSNWISDQSIVK